MTTTNHYGEARDILNKTGRRRSGTSEHDLAAAQVHAMLATRRSRWPRSTHCC